MTDVTLRIRGDASGVIRASADASRAVSGIGQASQQAGTAGRRAGQQIAEGADQAAQASQRAAQAMRSLVASAAAAFGTAQIIQAADAYTRMTGALTLATDSASELAATQQMLFDIAQANRAPLEATVSLYTKLSGALKESGATSAELASITSTISQAMAISGTSAAAAEGAITQLGQAFASGALRGDEFNSVNEAAPRLMQALAASLGVGRGALRAMAEQGQLTAEVLSRALTGEQARKIAEEFAKLPPTLSQATTVAGNALTKFVGEMDAALGVSRTLAEGVIGAANAIGNLGSQITLIKDVFSAAFVGLAAFAGAKGLMLLTSSAGAASTALAALLTRLGAVPALMAYVSGTMTGGAAAMTGFAAAGRTVVAMLGGWPVIVAAAAAGLALLVSRLMSAQDEAVAAAQEMRRQYEQTNAQFIAARQMFRQQNADVIGADIAAQEQLIARMTGRFSEQSVAMKSARERLVELQAEYKKAGGQLTALTGTQTAARAAAEQFNAGLREQAKQLQLQQAAAKGGAAAAAALASSEIDWSRATAAQRAERDQLLALLKASQPAQDSLTRSTTSGAAADRDAARAVEERRQAMAALVGIADRLAAEMGGPVLRAAQQYRDALVGIAQAEERALAAGQNAAEVAALSAQARANAADIYAQATEQANQRAADSGQQMVDASAQQADEMTNYWSGAADAIARSFGDFVASGLKSFSDFGRSLKRIAQQIISGLVAQFGQSRITVPIMLGAGVSPAAIAGATGMSPAAVAASAGNTGMLGGILGGIGGALGGFSAGLGVAGAAGFSAASSFGLASIAAGNFAVGLGALAGALGPIGLALGGINAITGGRLFGTSYSPTGVRGSQLNFGESGASGFNFEEQSRRRSLFRGTARRTVESALGEDAQAQIDQFFAQVGTAVAQAAAQLGVDIPQRITASFRATTDAQGNVISEVGTILGRQYNESFEVFSRRIAAENVIGVLDAALDGEAGRIAEAWRGSADTLADGAQFLLNAATDMRGGFRLLGDSSLTGVAELVQRLAGDGESLTAAYARISGATVLLTDAVELMGVDLGRTREQFVEFAAGIAEAAGGLEQAQGLWRGYFQSFYTEQERGLVQLQQARQRGTAQAAGLGLDLSQFTGAGGMQAFRELFESRLPTLSADQVVAWLQFGSTLANITDLQGRYTDAVAQTAETIGEFMAGIDAALGEFAPEQTLEQQLAAQRAQNAELIARAQELGASEAELARVRQLGDARIQQIIGSVSQQAATLTGSLRRLGITISGSAEDIAVLASQMSGDFDSLFEEFLGSFYSETEQGAQRLSVAQANLSAALQAAGLASDELISREQLRAQIEAALAAGNIVLAESLLRVASAMNAVDAAAGSAVGSGSVGGGGGGGGGGGLDTSAQWWAANGQGGDPAGGLVDDIERIRQGLRDWLQSLTTGDLSPERPRDQLRRAQAEYQRLLTAAAGGDADALRQLQGASEQVLRLGRQVFGSSAGYTSLYNQILAQVGGLVGFGGGPIGGGGGGSTRPVDDLGDSAGRAAAALDALADRLGMPAGSLTVPSPQFGGVSDQASSETAARPVVQELQRGRTAAAEDNARLRAEIAELSARMDRMSAAAERQAEQLARSNDYRRV